MRSNSPISEKTDSFDKFQLVFYFGKKFKKEMEMLLQLQLNFQRKHIKKQFLWKWTHKKLKTMQKEFFFNIYIRACVIESITPFAVRAGNWISLLFFSIVLCFSVLHAFLYMNIFPYLFSCNSRIWCYFGLEKLLFGCVVLKILNFMNLIKK